MLTRHQVVSGVNCNLSKWRMAFRFFPSTPREKYTSICRINISLLMQIHVTDVFRIVLNVVYYNYINGQWIIEIIYGLNKFVLPPAPFWIWKYYFQFFLMIPFVFIFLLSKTVTIVPFFCMFKINKSSKWVHIGYVKHLKANMEYILLFILFYMEEYVTIIQIKMHLQKCFFILRMWLHYLTHK